MMLRPLCSIVLLGCAAASAHATEPGKLSSAQIEKILAAPQQGSLSQALPTGANGPKVLVIRRLVSGEAEVHDELDDVFVVRSGRATVTVGGTVAGNRQTGPGEWRGGAITGGTDYAVGPGDVLTIPAGMPHRVIVPAGGDFSYLAFKYPKPKPF